MEDPVFITFQTFDRTAARMLKHDEAPLDTPADRQRVEKFLMRTGRPVPNVLVLGSNLAIRARQIDELGGAAVGLDGGEHVIELAQQRYPGGHFVQGDLRKPPVDSSFFDGAWTGSVLAHIPRKDVAKAMAGVHKSLRPGGLLYVRLPLGDEAGFEETPDGPVYRVRWDEQQFVEAIGALDFDRIDRDELGDNEVGLIFRREY